ncbi:MAG: FAD-dependent monooxygenase, partial [Acidimicrobiales bacterium]
ARTHGVDIREGTALDTIVNETDSVRITTTDGSTIEAKYAIAADGMWSPTRKALGLATPGYLGEWHALRQYFRNVDTSTEHELFVWFDADLLPGYIWSFPLPNGRANVGFGILRGTIKTKDMSRLWADILQRPHIREVLGPKAEPEAPHRAWPIPARVGALPLTLGRTLFVGDAAAATDPMTGEGIGQALWTGIAAVEATLGAPTPEAVRTEYELAVHNHLVIDHRFAEQLGKILQHPLGTRAAVRVSGATE